MQDAAHTRLARARKRRVVQYTAGDRIYMQLPVLPRSFVKKCTLPWFGPFVIADGGKSGRSYPVKIGKQIRLIHESRLKPVHSAPDEDVREATVQREFEEHLDLGRVVWGHMAYLLAESNGTQLESQPKYLQSFAVLPLESEVTYRSSKQQQASGIDFNKI